MAPTVYDRLCMEILLFLEHGRLAHLLETFKSKLKTYLFTIAYDQ